LRVIILQTTIKLVSPSFTNHTFRTY